MLVLLEQLSIDQQVFKHIDRNREFLNAHPDEPMPPIAMLVDAQGHWDYDIYFRSGLKMARQIASWMKEFLGDRPVRFLEWGCGPARFLRHLPAVAGVGNDFHGSDYNGATIEWCGEKIPGVTFKRNNLEPPLPYEDDAFDFVFARSVFTHLTQANGLQWMQELQRVVAPGGVICFSTGGDTFLAKLTDTERTQYLAGEPVVNERDAEGQKLFSIKHPPSWVRANLLDGLELLRFLPGDGTQDVWIARLPNAQE